MASMVLQLESIFHDFGKSSILQDLNFSLASRSSVALVGASGSGKSTLLHIAGLLLAPKRGRIAIANVDASNILDHKRAAYRNTFIGIIYQFHNLLLEFTVLENVALPLWVAGRDRRESLRIAEERLDDVDMGAFKHEIPSTLSGGEAQRVAVARALVNAPQLILADEPTGNLDAKNSINTLNLLIDMVKKYGASLLCATHDMYLAQKLDKVMSLTQGKIR